MLEKVTKISFMRELKRNDSCFILSTSNTNDNDIIDYIDNIDISKIIYDRAADFSGLSVKFTFLKNDELCNSFLDLKNCNVFQYKNFYITKEIYNDIVYFLIYKISNEKKLNFSDIKNKILEDEKKEQKEKRKKEELKKEEDFKIYFNHRYFDKEKISKSSNLQLGRLKKALEKQYCYDGVIKTVKENLENLEITHKEITKKPFNRNYFNRLDGDSQNKYLSNLEKSKIYNFCFSDGYSFEIPKIIYDALIDDFKIVDNPALFGLKHLNNKGNFLSEITPNNFYSKIVKFRKTDYFNFESKKEAIKFIKDEIAFLKDNLKNDYADDEEAMKHIKMAIKTLKELVLVNVKTNEYELLVVDDKNAIVESPTKFKKDYKREFSESVTITKDNISLGVVDVPATKKLYNTSYGIGSLKYCVFTHNGLKFHNDGSRFFDINIFKNKKKYNDHIKNLLNDGYVYGTGNS